MEGSAGSFSETRCSCSGRGALDTSCFGARLKGGYYLQRKSPDKYLAGGILLTLIQWIATYPVNSVIQPTNNYLNILPEILIF